MPPRERPEEQREGAGGAAAGVGAATAGTAAAGTAPAAGTAVIGTAVIAETTAAVLAALRAFWTREETDADWLYAALRLRHPAEPEDELVKLARLEKAYGDEFRRRMSARLERDVPRALLASDPKRALRKLLEREKRYIRQRQQAMLARSISTIERDGIKRISPLGAYWRLSPFVKEHTIDCIAMGGKFWPWEVLDVIHPPRHANCPCELYGLDEAIARGFLPFGFTPPDPADGIELARELQQRFKELREALLEEGELEAVVEEIEADRLQLEENRWAKRYAEGTEKGGQFMPKRGGFSARIRSELASSVNGLMRVGSGRGRTRPQLAPPEPKPPGGHSDKSYKEAWAKSEQVAEKLRRMPGAKRPKTSYGYEAESMVGTLPKSFEAFSQRVSEGAGAAAEAHHARLVFKGLDYDPEEPDTTALRWWDGTAAIGVDAPSNLQAGAAAQEGETDPKAASGAWLTYSRAAHEAVGHGVNPIKPAEYKTAEGYTLEEALAEEVGREEAAAWLETDGHTDALEWLAANPTHPRALGPYTVERARLATLLDAAEVPPEARRDLLRTMSLRQGHQARLNTLTALVINQGELEAPAAAEFVRQRLAGEHDSDLGIDGIGAEGHLPVMPAAELRGGGGSAKTAPETPPEAAGGADSSSSEVPAASQAPVPLVDVSGPRGFDARHYSDPRRSLLRKMKALPEGEALELADGTKVKRGPKGSFRVTRPGGGKGKLYSTPQRAVNAETVGILERHGVGGNRLKAARQASQAKPQRAPSEDAWKKGVPDEFLDEGSLGLVHPPDGMLPLQQGDRVHSTKEWLGNREGEIIDVDGMTVTVLWAGASDSVYEDRDTLEPLQPRIAPQRAPAEVQLSLESPPAAITGIPTYDAAGVQLKDFEAAGGSNGAKFATDQNGQKWLVKAYRGDTDRVATELLANAVYRELGVRVPEAGRFAGEPDFSVIPDEPINEPPLPELPEIPQIKGIPYTPEDGVFPDMRPKRKEQATGMVVLEDDGSVWLFEPKGHFGGYQNTFSKGRLEKGLTPQQNARKELWEELGMRANPVAYLGDYEGDKTMTRFYVARRTSDPVDPPGGETAERGVKKVIAAEALELLNKARDRDILLDAMNGDWPEGDREDRVPEAGATRLAYPLVDGKTERWQGASQELGEGFMADALLGNWDVVGLDQDNVLWDAEGSPIRVDQGGTFEFRAMGKPKEFGPVPTEVWTMRSPKGQAFGRMELSEEMMRDQAADIAERLTPQRIDDLVDEAPFDDAAMRERVRGNLKARVTFMRGLADGTEVLPGPLQGEEADRQLEEDRARLEPLFPEEERAIAHLLEGDDIDSHLRSGAPKQAASLEVQGSVEQLDGLLGQARAGEDFNVYMPISFEALGADGDALAGKRFREASYLLGSTDEQAARDAGKAVLRLLVPEGTHVFGLGDLSTEPGAVIFRRSTGIRIAGATTEDGVTYIDAVVS